MGKTKKTEISTELEGRLCQFEEVINAALKAYHSNVHSDTHQLERDEGSRYLRYWDHRSNDRAIYCFIDKTNGDLLKPATWKAPAKHARGNLLLGNWLDQVSPYGLKYLTGSSYEFWPGNIESAELSVATDALLDGRISEVITMFVNRITQRRGALKCSRCGERVHKSWDHLVIGDFGERWKCTT